MTRTTRWAVVALGVLVLVAVPVLLRAWPAAPSRVDAATLLARVQHADDVGWSGLVETEGGLQLPDADRFSDLGQLLGERNRLRVWWRDADHWRVDQLRPAGETDLVHDVARTTQYDYERAEARVSADPAIRLPRASDLVPLELAHRLLAGVDPAQASRLPARRVAGVSAPGLRVVPADGRSSIGRVDLWADEASGVPLRVEVYADGDRPSFVATLLAFDRRRPSVTAVSYRPTFSTDYALEDVLDIADAANQFAPIRPPASIAGLPAADASRGAVGVYGRGLSQAIAIPLRDREADALRDQLDVTPGAEVMPRRRLVSVGPLGLVLTGAPGEGGFLVAGTLNRSTLLRAADDVLAGFRYTGAIS